MLLSWFDLFSNNQHDLDKPPPFEWWCDTFMNAIKDIGFVIMVMSPWTDPLILTRCWCWEIYCATMKSTFEIAVGNELIKNCTAPPCISEGLFKVFCFRSPKGLKCHWIFIWVISNILLKPGTKTICNILTFREGEFKNYLLKRNR